jgi:RNA polymerase sigma-70 factor (ECF subfamily)
MDMAVERAADRDADIAALLAHGDPGAAFEALVDRYEGKVYRLCRSLLRDSANAEDATQDSLLRAWRSLAGYDATSGALSTWLYAITRNRCLTLLGRARAPEVALDDDTGREIAERVAAPSPPISPDGVQALRALVEELPDAQRSAVLLYYYEERAVGEVAAMLGLPEGTVKTHLHRGRAGLLERMGRQGLAEPSMWLHSGDRA